MERGLGARPRGDPRGQFFGVFAWGYRLAVLAEGSRTPRWRWRKGSCAGAASDTVTWPGGGGADIDLEGRVAPWLAVVIFVPSS